MTLGLAIDTADFRALVDVALRRIPTASRGNWTLHAPVDPGITLVELFAWLLEQRSYWADQVTAPLVDRVMALLGEQLRGPSSAGVAVTFEPDAAVGWVSRRTTLRVPETELEFTLQHAVLALAVARHPTLAGRSAVPKLAPPKLSLYDVAGYSGEDLRSGRPVPILPAHGGPASARLEIELAAPAPASSQQGGKFYPVAILFELDTAVLPEWHPEAVAAQPPAIVRWEARDASGWQAVADLHDGTLGLRRSGIVRFAVPASWAGATKVEVLRIATDHATFSSPPTVVRIAPNSALAAHTAWRRYTASPSWLPLPARTIQLEPGPLPIPASVFVVIAERSGRRRWRVVPDLVRSGPADRVLVVDRKRSRIVLGDGLTGRVPRVDPNAAPQVIVHYAAGGGVAGNLPPVDVWEATGGTLPFARSYVAAVGGEDPESLDDARTRATGDLQQPTRAVTPDDHAVLACTGFAGSVEHASMHVARAHAEPGLVLGECGVVPGVTTVFVVPGNRSRTRDDVRTGTAVIAPAADPGMLAELRARFALARLVGETVVVVSAAYRCVRIRVTVSGAPHDRDGVRRRIVAVVRNFLDALEGGDVGIGWPFGEPIRPTALIAVAQREIGNRGDVTDVEIAIDGGAFQRCDDVSIRPYELVAVTGVDVVIESATSQEVGLR